LKINLCNAIIKIMRNKRELIIAFASLLIGVVVTYLFLHSYISTASQNSKIKDITTQGGTIIAAQTGSFNGNGKIDTIQLQLLSKFNETVSPKKNARLVLIEDGKEISTKDVTLENNIGYLELVSLFNNRVQQILFTTGVGAHSMDGFFYQLKNVTLSPICPDDNQGNKEQGLDCFFSSDAPSIYAKDLDGDGISEIIVSGHSYYNSQTSDTIYKWNGSIYKTVTGAQYDKLLTIVKGKE